MPFLFDFSLRLECQQYGVSDSVNAANVQKKLHVTYWHSILCSLNEHNYAKKAYQWSNGFSCKGETWSLHLHRFK